MSDLGKFIRQYAGRPDAYEVWGGCERPAHVVTLGELRTLQHRVNVAAGGAEDWDNWSNGIAERIPEHYEDDVAQEAIILRWLDDLMAGATRVIAGDETGMDLLRYAVEADPDEALTERIWKMRLAAPVRHAYGEACERNRCRAMRADREAHYPEVTP